MKNLDKSKIIKELILKLEDNLEKLILSAKEAHEAATNEESKAENKYDTRGLEASYLAGAQAKRSADLGLAIDQLKKTRLSLFDKDDAIQLTALIKTFLNDENEKIFFILPYGGGQKIIFDHTEIQIITPESPIGQLFIEKHVGDSFQLKQGSGRLEYEIISIA